ncbi:MAG: hypothetical protein IPG52_10035 [Rhodocyclaceae bacterium]|nr:hypothetical protein [Rhodocyclaceae bacterium]
MLDKLWKGRALAKAANKKQARTLTFESGKLKQLAAYFPIGRKLLYYPEYHQKAVLHTLVIGYRVNERLIYANDAVLLDGQGHPTGFRLDGGEVLPVDKLASFEMLVPDTSEMERKLDYVTRASLGPAGQFRKGNTITLVAENVERCLPSIDTTVERRQVMDEGPYAGSATILLAPDFATLKVVDKRRHQRVAAALWADLYFAKDTPPFRCVLRDFSENSLRLGIGAEGQRMPALKLDGRVIVEFDFGSIETTYRIRGKVMRGEDDFCVVCVEQLYRDGDFERIRMMDAIEIKTRLLNARP